MNSGIRWLMNSLVFLSNLTDLTRGNRREQANLKGLAGIANLEVAGDSARGWHFQVDCGRLRIHQGLHPDAGSSVRLADTTFADLLAGQQSATTAMMTGRVLMHGELGPLLFLSLCANFRQLAQGRNWLGRIFARFVLRHAKPLPAASPGER